MQPTSSSPARGVGGLRSAVSYPVRSGAEPRQKSILVYFCIFVYNKNEEVKNVKNAFFA